MTKEAFAEPDVVMRHHEVGAGGFGHGIQDKAIIGRVIAFEMEAFPSIRSPLLSGVNTTAWQSHCHCGLRAAIQG